jgi:hypothetical protein
MSRAHARPKKSLEEIITPIVEGQLRTYGLAHPALVQAVDWRHSHASKLDAFVASGAKRITTALLCDQTIARLRSAIQAGE